MSEVFLNSNQAAQLLGIKVGTITRYLNQGKIPGTRLGNTWKIPQSAINELAIAKKTKGSRGAKMHAYLKLADSLHPVIMAGVAKEKWNDPAEIVDQTRENRDEEILRG